WELIVMDGGSIDGSVSVIRNYENNIAFWESKPDRSIYNAWNKALNYARGEWICFLGADDYFWNSDVLSDVEPHLKKAADAGIKVVYGQAAKVNRHGRVIKTVGKPWGKIRWLMRHGMPMIHAGVMHHRSLFDIHGQFDESFKIAGDYEFLLRELKNGQALFADGVRIVGHQVGGISTVQNLLMHLEVARARRRNRLPSFSYVWAVVFLRAFIRQLWRSIFPSL
ncbi:MAG: glycosyltransferase, partial [Desulfobacterales bacterium]|nr:glycosyltransferase [Candidatus Desulfatibia vada]